MPPPLIRCSSLIPALVAGALIATSGCSTVRHYDVEALRRPDAMPPVGKYRIVPARDENGDSSPYFRMVAREVRAVLNAQGLVEVAESESADVDVEIDFHIDPPRVVPRLGSEPAYNAADGTPFVRKQSAGDGHNLATTTLDFDLYYDSRLTVVGRENEAQSAESPGKEVWRVEVTSIERRVDADRSIPQMVAAGSDYLGTVTNGRVRVAVNGDHVWEANDALFNKPPPRN